MVTRQELVKVDGERLKLVRKSLRLSQPALAKLSGVPAATISRAEHGLVELSPESMGGLVGALADETGLGYERVVQWLMGGGKAELRFNPPIMYSLSPSSSVEVRILGIPRE
jgi:transcriptional regulator with XRE-family HTH domain